MNNKVAHYNYSHSSIYLLKCDLIQKFNLINIYDYPEIERISIIFSSRQLREKASIRKEMCIRIIGFLFVYILVGLNPEIQYIKEKTVDYSSKQAKNSFFNQIVSLDNKYEIYKFINFLFVQNRLNKNIGSISIKKKKISSSTIELTAFFPISIFQDAVEYASSEIVDLIAKDLEIKVVFYVKNVTKIENNNFSILSNFWHIG